MSHSVSNTTITSAPGGGARRGGTGNEASAAQGEQTGRNRPPRNRNRNNNRSIRSGNTNDGTTTPRTTRASAFKGATEGMNGAGTLSAVSTSTATSDST